MRPLRSMHSRQRRTLLRFSSAGLALAALGGLLPQARAAVVLEGVSFDDRITLAGRELQLNGTGLRAAGWFKLYVAALYLPSRAGTAEQALAQAGPKRVRVVMLRKAPGPEFGKAVDKGVLRNVNPAEQEALRERLARLTDQMRAVPEVRGGDIVDLDHDPVRGTVMLLNAKVQGPWIPGADFYPALLRSFIGEHPYHRDLRAGLLGAPAKS